MLVNWDGRQECWLCFVYAILCIKKVIILGIDDRKLIYGKWRNKVEFYIFYREIIFGIDDIKLIYG